MLDFSNTDVNKVKVLIAIAPACCIMGPMPIILASYYLFKMR